MVILVAIDVSEENIVVSYSQKEEVPSSLVAMFGSVLR